MTELERGGKYPYLKFLTSFHDHLRAGRIGQPLSEWNNLTLLLRCLTVFGDGEM